MGPAVPGFLNAANLAFGSDRPSRTELTVQLVIRCPRSCCTATATVCRRQFPRSATTVSSAARSIGGRYRLRDISFPERPPEEVVRVVQGSLMYNDIGVLWLLLWVPVQNPTFRRAPEVGSGWARGHSRLGQVLAGQSRWSDGHAERRCFQTRVMVENRDNSIKQGGEP